MTEPVDPARFGVTAVLQHLEDRDRYPLVVFDRPLNLLGEVSAFPLVTNVYASRERCAAGPRVFGYVMESSLVGPSARAASTLCPASLIGAASGWV